MIPSTPTHEALPPIARLERMMALGERFESEWRRGLRPTIESYLADVPAADRAEVVSHLIALEIDLRSLVGEEPDPNEYRERFPEATPSEAVTEARFPFLAPAEERDELGRLGGFRVLGVIGMGGMGVVFRAWDLRLDRPVALKVVRPEYCHDEKYRRRFLQEARATAALTSDHVVPIYGSGEDRGVLYLVMPLLAGETLDARLKREETFPPDEVIRIGQEAAEGLAAAHAGGLIHRDVKPSNLWLETNPDPSRPARVRLLDFGLVRSINPSETISEGGQLVGTPEYMSPEQIAGTPALDPRTDLFSLGVVLYRAATGVRPFWRPALTAILSAVADYHPTPPRDAAPLCPSPLSHLIERLLSKDRDDRPPSARAVADALRDVGSLLADAETVLVSPKPPATPDIAGPVKLGRWRWVVGLLAACMVAAALGTAWWRPWSPSPASVTHRGSENSIPDGTGHIAPAPVTFRGSVNVVLVQQGRRSVYRALADPGALPVQSGDRFQVEAKVGPAAYVYLFWITTEGTVEPVYPWTPGKWGTRPSHEQPVTELSLPTNKTVAYTFDGPQSGMESFLLIARPDPLPLDDNAIRALFAGIVPQRRLDDGRAVVWFDDGKVVEGDPRRTRGHFDETPTNHVLLQMLDVLQRRLGPYASTTTAVSFAKSGP